MEADTLQPIPQHIDRSLAQRIFEFAVVCGSGGRQASRKSVVDWGTKQRTNKPYIHSACQYIIINDVANPEKHIGNDLLHFTFLPSMCTLKMNLQSNSNKPQAHTHLAQHSTAQVWTHRNLKFSNGQLVMAATTDDCFEDSSHDARQTHTHTYTWRSPGWPESPDWFDYRRILFFFFFWVNRVFAREVTPAQINY